MLPVNSNSNNRTIHKSSDNENTTGENFEEKKDSSFNSPNRNLKKKTNHKSRESTKIINYEIKNTKEVFIIFIAQFFIKQNKLFEDFGETKILLNNLINESSQLSYMFEDFQKNQLKNTAIKKLEFEEDFCFGKDNTNLEEFFGSNNEDLDSNVLLFVDPKNNIWELIKRKDLNIELFNRNECMKIESLKNYFLQEQDVPELCRFDNNIVFEENKDISITLNNSDLEISKNTEFNSVSKVIKETINLISEV